MKADIDELIKNNTKPTSPNSQSPTTYSHVYLRVQPYYTTYEDPASPPVHSTEPSTTMQKHLQFLLYLSDPAHQLTHTTITQAVPGKWLTIWDEYEWVEDLVAEALRVGVEVVGQEYLVARMGWGGKTKIENLEDSTQGTSSTEPTEKDGRLGEP